MFNQPALDKFNGGEYKPGKYVQTDKQIEDYLRQHLETIYHPVSTCRMGTDDMSVVDTDFKVKGIEGLRKGF
jgi:choline dehydrogenase